MVILEPSQKTIEIEPSGIFERPHRGNRLCVGGQSIIRVVQTTLNEHEREPKPRTQTMEVVLYLPKVHRTIGHIAVISIYYFRLTCRFTA